MRGLIGCLFACTPQSCTKQLRVFQYHLHHMLVTMVLGTFLNVVVEVKNIHRSKSNHNSSAFCLHSI